MQIKTAYLTSCGGRSANDDTACIGQEGTRTWVFVGDGLGGYAGGKLASQAAGDALVRAAQSGGLLAEEGLLTAADAADRAVRQVQQREKGRMKTTMVFLYLDGAQARWMHVGDSRLYHFQGARLKSQTMDHSVSQMAVLMGEITPDQIRFHEDRSRVLRALGADNARVELSPPTPLRAGVDAFLLCTDGFWEYVYEEEMQRALAAADSPAAWLGEMERLLQTRAPAEHDNYTAVAVFCE